MRELKLVRLLGAVVLLAAAPVLGAVAVYAQKSPTEAPGAAPPSPGLGMPKGGLEAPPSGSTTDPAEMPSPSKKPGDPATPAQITPMQPSLTPPGGGTGAGKGAALDTKPVPGLSVMAADGQRVGEVSAVKAGSDGKIEAIHVKTGGMLGFGGRTVSIAPGKFTVAGQNVQLSMTASEVAKLPAIDPPQG
jgi:hypothetical protein